MMNAHGCDLELSGLRGEIQRTFQSLLYRHRPQGRYIIFVYLVHKFD